MRLKKFYDSQAGEAAIVSGRIRKAAKMFARRGGPYERLLDIGCGVGNIALYLKEAVGAREVYGVEIAEKQVKAARQKGVEAFAVDVGVERLPFDDGFFDVIFCGEVIEHLIDTDHLLDEVYRTLSPKGLCVLTTPNLAAWYNRLTLLLGFQPFYTQVGFHHPVGRLPLVGGFGAGGTGGDAYAPTPRRLRNTLPHAPEHEPDREPQRLGGCVHAQRQALAQWIDDRALGDCGAARSSEALPSRSGIPRSPPPHPRPRSHRARARFDRGETGRLEWSHLTGARSRLALAQGRSDGP